VLTRGHRACPAWIRHGVRHDYQPDQAIRARVVREEIEFGIAQLAAVLAGPLGADMLLAATGSATAARRLTFRCERGRSSGRSDTNDCRRSRLIAETAHDSDRNSKLNIILAAGGGRDARPALTCQLWGIVGILDWAGAIDVMPRSRPVCHFRR
jgi:hypothetical protein